MGSETKAVVVGECFDARNYDRLDDLVADDMVNVAAGPQGCEGWKAVWRAIVTCFSDVRSETKRSSWTVTVLSCR